MAETSLPKNVTYLLDRHIHSVSQLETLLFLRKFSQRKWTANEIANEMHTNDAAALEMLGSLAEAELIKREESSGNISQFCYVLTQDDSLEADIDSLAQAYKISRVRVIDRIYHKPSQRRTFEYIADCFKLRDDDR